MEHGRKVGQFIRHSNKIQYSIELEAIPNNPILN
jgi:hypothetical protein